MIRFGNFTLFLILLWIKTKMLHLWKHILPFRLDVASRERKSRRASEREDEQNVFVVFNTKSHLSVLLNWWHSPLFLARLHFASWKDELARTLSLFPMLPSVVWTLTIHRLPHILVHFLLYLFSSFLYLHSIFHLPPHPSNVAAKFDARNNEHQQQAPQKLYAIILIIFHRWF